MAEMCRVNYHWPKPQEGPVTWPELAQRLAGYEQVLAVVDRRADAYELATELKAQVLESDSVHHLSALMCPAHRLAKIRVIRCELKQGTACRVVSTQLIEAGVDVDFPAVYRALAGLDRIAQAAGRCNREGRLESGEVHVFQSPSEPPPGEMRQALEATKSLLQERGGSLDVTDPALFDLFFRYYYGSPTDERNVLRECEQFNFAATAGRFKMIDSAHQVTVVCPWGEGKERIEVFRRAQEADCLSRDHYRRLQPFFVQIYTRQCDALVCDGVLMPLSEGGLFELAPGHRTRYDEQFGLLLASDAKADPGELMC